MSRQRNRCSYSQTFFSYIQAPPPLPTSIKNTPQALALKTEATRRITQGNHENEYQQALGTIKEKIKETEGPDIKETMMDQIRQWFIECRQVTHLLVRCSMSAVRSHRYICCKATIKIPLSALLEGYYQQYEYLMQIMMSHLLIPVGCSICAHKSYQCLSNKSELQIPFLHIAKYLYNSAIPVLY